MDLLLHHDCQPAMTNWLIDWLILFDNWLIALLTDWLDDSHWYTDWLTKTNNGEIELTCKLQGSTTTHLSTHPGRIPIGRTHRATSVPRWVMLFRLTIVPRWPLVIIILRVLWSVVVLAELLGTTFRYYFIFKKNVLVFGANIKIYFTEEVALICCLL